MSTMINNPEQFPMGETKVILSGPAGKLETLTSEPHGGIKNIVAIVCHPHPLFGGTMHNKVVYTIARAFKEMKLRTVRFNFRGVGESDGSYAEGIGETDDLLSVLNWVKHCRPQDEIWLAGFSFGCYVAVRGAQVATIRQLLTVAPAVESFDFKSLPRPACPWLVIQGGQDEIVSSQAVYAWCATLQPPPKLIRIEEAGHFFHGKLLELRHAITTSLLVSSTP